MAKPQSLKAQDRKRTGTGVLRQMRREGYIPSIVYGGGAANRNVKVSAKAFRDMIAHSASSNILVDLELDGGSRQLAFVQDLQHDPLSGDVLHADFLAVNEDTEITAQIPVELTGDPVGVKAGGVLEQQLHTIEIRCLPKNLPETLKGDVSQLQIGDVLHVGAVSWPEGVAATLADDVVVALVTKARVALEEEGEELEGEPAVEGEAPAEEGAGEGEAD